MPGRPSVFLRKCRLTPSFFTSTTRPYSISSSEFISSLSPSQESRFKDLSRSLSLSADPSYVWATYTNLIALLGNKPLPLEFHQQVLRRCTPPWRDLRDSLLRQIKAGQRSFVPPDVESRFHSLVNNIRFAGVELTVDDYNFILSQFASYGHYEATSKLYREMQRVGVTPDDRTFAYCLRAMAFRLDLPIHKKLRPHTVERVQSLFKTYMADMKTYQVPVTSRILDLSLRIMKETVDLEGLEHILRTAYAVDLSNLDRVPLEFSSEPGKDQPIPFPFTTTILNTTLDTLGMVGTVSKLVQAFEVLTNPLPRASQHFFNSFESDEEGDFGVAVNITPPFPTPSARPNTTSYVILLRHLCKAGHHTLARHYLLEAIRRHQLTSWRLRMLVEDHFTNNKPFHDIPRPHFQVSRLMLLSVLSECMRDKHFPLMVWLGDKLPRLIKRLKRDLEYYSSVRDGLQASGRTHSPSTQNVSPVHHLFDAEIETAGSAPSDIPQHEPFDINLHIEILARNLKDIESFQKTLAVACARTAQRIKERLGRRVWEQKDIYIRTESGRVLVDKDRWRKIVNFRIGPSTPNQESKPVAKSQRTPTVPPIFGAFKSFGKR